jgi:hypothetical protein
MHGWPNPTTLAVAAALLIAGCGGTDESPIATTPPAKRSEVQGRRITVRGDYAPGRHGPFPLSGRYRVRFTQRGTGVDFAREVPFTAHLEEPAAGRRGRTVALFRRAERSGATTVTAHGRYDVVVDFGDSPYTVVFEPAAR